MRILHLITDTDRRGAQVFATELSERLGERGHDSLVMALRPGNVGGLDVETIRASSGGRIRTGSLRWRMAEVDITVAHGSSTLLACILAGRGASRPFVYRQISDPLFWTPTAARRRRVRWYYRYPARVVALSTTTLAVLTADFGVDATRISVIPNAVDDRRCPRASADDRARSRSRLGIHPDERVIGYVGALVDEKGVMDLVHALPPGALLVCAGGGPLRAELDRVAAAGGRRMLVLGQVDDPWDTYAASDVIALPSRGGDTQPATLIEAALVGTPVVATPVGAVEDIVQDGHNGRLVPIGDSAALREALQQLLDDPTIRARLSERAATDARARFSMHSVATVWDELLRSIPEH